MIEPPDISWLGILPELILGLGAAAGPPDRRAVEAAAAGPLPGGRGRSWRWPGSPP